MGIDRLFNVSISHGSHQPWQGQCERLHCMVPDGQFWMGSWVQREVWSLCCRLEWSKSYSNAKSICPLLSWCNQGNCDVIHLDFLQHTWFQKLFPLTSWFGCHYSFIIYMLTLSPLTHTAVRKGWWIALFPQLYQVPVCITNVGRNRIDY